VDRRWHEAGLKRPVVVTAVAHGLTAFKGPLTALCSDSERALNSVGMNEALITKTGTNACPFSSSETH
jgi:hypothetical protein